MKHTQSCMCDECFDECGDYFANQVIKALEEYKSLDKPKSFNTVEELFQDLDGEVTDTP